MLNFSFVKNIFAKHKILVMIFFLALILRLGALTITFYQYGSLDHLNIDGYFQIAKNLFEHGAYSQFQDYSIIDSQRPPGLPYLIYPFFFFPNGALAYALFQILAACFIPIMAFAIAKTLGFTQKWSLGVAFFLALDPMGISLSIKFFSETFFTFFFLLFVLFFIRFLQNKREKHLLASAVFLGISNLFRPTAVYLPLVLAIFFALSTFWKIYVPKMRSIVIILAVPFLVVLPWMARNASVFEKFALSSVKEEVLYTALAPSILAVKEDISYAQAQEKLFLEDGFGGFPNTNFDQAENLKEKAFAVIKKYPLEFLQVCVINAFAFFTHDGSRDLLGLFGLGSIQRDMFSPALAFILGMRLVWTICALAFFASSLYLFISKKMDYFAFFLFLCIIYFALTTLTNGLAVNARFRFPVNALMLIIITQGIYTYISRNSLHLSSPSEKVS